MSDLFEKVSVKQKNKRTQKEKHCKGAKKEVHDLFVQGTNDSSIVSKRSVETLYSFPVDGLNTHYFNHFVKKAPRRTPVINRGYWIRMRSIRMAVEKIINGQPDGQRINIVNLGCGYDPLPFQLLDDSSINDKKLFCIDIDYPELANYKSQMIKMSPELLSITGNPKDSVASKGITFQTDNYALMGCDLTNQKLFSDQMDSLKANEPNTTNIFIAEVSLAYMTPGTANPIIETSSKFYNTHFLILEQLMPSGRNHPFAKRMLNHFKKMEAPLQCVETYPTIDSQIERFMSLGFKTARARDLLGCWELVDDELKNKVYKVEPFDEWEEFFFFGQHYINLHATNQVEVQVYDPKKLHPYPEMKSITNITSKVNKDVTIERKFSTSFEVDSVKLLTCGTNQSRLSSSLQLGSLEENKVEITPSDSFKPRIAATGVTINDTVYLIGGRRIPGVGIDEFWKLQRVSGNGPLNWIQLPNLTSGRVKHTTIAFEKGILLFGGVKAEDTFEYYSIETEEWIRLTSNLNFTLESSNLVEVDGVIYLYGGMKHGEGIDQFEFNDTLFKLEIDLQIKHISCSPILVNESLARYGSQASSLETGKFLIIGGVGSKCYDQNDTIIEVGLHSLSVSGVAIGSTTWDKSNPLIGFSIIKSGQCLYLIGGGAVCYGFGAVWGSVQTLSLSKQCQADNFGII